jgi:L-fucose mutarotase
LNNDAAQKGEIHHGIDELFLTVEQKFSVTPLSGDALYPRIGQAYAIIATSEPALFANVILRKAALPAAKE